MLAPPARRARFGFWSSLLLNFLEIVLRTSFHGSLPFTYSAPTRISENFTENGQQSSTVLGNGEKFLGRVASVSQSVHSVHFRAVVVGHGERMRHHLSG